MNIKNLETSLRVRRRSSSPWGPERRLEFIDFRLQWDGRLNRSDLMQHFSISVPQASADIAAYSDLVPGNLRYDRSARVYTATSEFQPAFPTTTVEHYLNDLLAQNTMVAPPEGSFLGWTPSVAVAVSPVRSVPHSILASVVRAIRRSQNLELLYQSMSRSEPSWRTVSPHALGHDGFRWHVRAFCHVRGAFRDFVFARALEVRDSGSTYIQSDNDSAWNTMASLVLEPRFDLNASKKRVVELDYAMTNGQVILETRQAMLFYVLQRLGLSRDGEVRAEAQQIQLKNASEIKAILEGLAKSYE
jgi:hypothetical protein